MTSNISEIFTISGNINSLEWKFYSNDYYAILDSSDTYVNVTLKFNWNANIGYYWYESFTVLI
jgi:hypothetical protein